jgi:hypothetical protein
MLGYNKKAAHSINTVASVGKSSFQVDKLLGFRVGCLDRSRIHGLP